MYGQACLKADALLHRASRPADLFKRWLVLCMFCQQLTDTLCMLLLVNECLHTLETRCPQCFEKPVAKQRYLGRERAGGLPKVLPARARLIGRGASSGELRESAVPRPGLAARPVAYSGILGASGIKP
jgi:hypothetical protein